MKKLNDHIQTAICKAIRETNRVIYVNLWSSDARKNDMISAYKGWMKKELKNLLPTYTLNTILNLSSTEIVFGGYPEQIRKITLNFNNSWNWVDDAEIVAEFLKTMDYSAHLYNPKFINDWRDGDYMRQKNTIDIVKEISFDSITKIKFD